MWIRDERIKPWLIPGGMVFPILSLWVAFSCSRYYRIPDIEGLPQITFERIFFFLLVVCVFVSVTLRKIHILPFRVAEISLWSITAVAAASGVGYGAFAGQYAGAGITILLDLLLFPATVFSIMVRTNFTRRDLSVFCFVLTLFGLYLALIAILERTSLSWVVFPPDIIDRTIDQHWGRSRGPFLQAEFNGTVMVQFILPALLLGGLAGTGRRILGIITAAFLCLGIFLTGTRAALASLLIILLLGAILHSTQRRIYLILCISTMTCAVLGYVTLGNILPRLNEIEPIQDRLKLLGVTFEMIRNHPIVGIGYGNFDIMQEAFFNSRNLIVTRFTEGELWAGGTHNTLLTLFAELGIMVGALFSVLVLRTLYFGFALFRSATVKEDDKARNLVICSLLVCIAFVANALAVELRYTLTPNALFWVFAAFVERYRAKVIYVGSNKKWSLGVTALPGLIAPKHKTHLVNQK